MVVASELTETPPSPARRGTLLIVDDEEGPRLSLKLIFKDKYDLLLADDGAKAIELAQQNDIDVAVLDIRMAGMSGIELLERLRFVRPDLEAIMITAFETTDTMRQALRLRAADYINKPFDIATIRAAVGAAMQRRMLERDIKKVMEGGDPEGVIFDPAQEMVHVPSGNFFRETASVAEPA